MIATHEITRQSALPQSVGRTDAYALHAASRNPRRVRATGRAALFSSLRGPAFSSLAAWVKAAPTSLLELPRLAALAAVGGFFATGVV